MKTVARIVCLLSSAGLLAGTPATPAASESTTAGRVRAALTPERLREVREQMSAMRSPHRWPSAQQDHWLRICLGQESAEPSINQRTCQCELEVMMDRYASLGALVKELRASGGASDERTAGLVGMCLASFGN